MHIVNTILNIKAVLLCFALAACSLQHLHHYALADIVLQIPHRDLAKELALTNSLPANVRNLEHKWNISYWLDLASKDYIRKSIKIPADCDRDLGMSYMNMWKATKIDFCQGSSSHILCHWWARYPGGACPGSMFCYINNMVFSSKAYLGELASKQPRIGYLQREAWPQPVAGAAKVSTHRRFSEDNLPGVSSAFLLQRPQV